MEKPCTMAMMSRFDFPNYKREAGSSAMGMMHWADCQKSKRTDRYRQRMDMMPLETVHGKKKMAKGLRTSTISSTRW